MIRLTSLIAIVFLSSCQTARTDHVAEIGIADLFGEKPLAVSAIDEEKTVLSKSGKVAVTGYLASRLDYPVLIDSVDGKCMDSGYASLLVDSLVLSNADYLREHRWQKVRIVGELQDAYSPLSRVEELDPGMVELGTRTFFGPLKRISSTEILSQFCEP